MELGGSAQHACGRGSFMVLNSVQPLFIYCKMRHYKLYLWTRSHGGRVAKDSLGRRRDFWTVLDWVTNTSTR